MGDGVVRKYALVINGSTEIRHLENVEMSLKVLHRGGYESYVVNAIQPQLADHYTTPTPENFQALITELRGKLDDDDDLVIYTTGHGLMDKGNLSFNDVSISDEAMHLLDIQNYGKRTVIMAQCYAGLWKNIFLDDPKTLFISEASGYQEAHGVISQRFWENNVRCICDESGGQMCMENVLDINEDGTINWLERFARAASYIFDSTPQFVASRGYVLDRTPPFSNSVRYIQNETEFYGALQELLPGQYAIVNFSNDGCGTCQNYEHVFEEAAASSQGQYLFIQTEDDELANIFNIAQFPTIIIFDRYGSGMIVRNINDVLGETSGFELSFPQEIYEMVTGWTGDRNYYGSECAYRNYVSEEYFRELSVLESLVAAKTLRDLFMNSSDMVRRNTILSYDILLDKLDDEEKLEGARALMEIIAEPYIKGEQEFLYNKDNIITGTAQGVAISTFVKLSDILPYSAIREGSRLILDRLEERKWMHMSGYPSYDWDSIFFLLKEYSLLSDKLEPREILNSVQIIRGLVEYSYQSTYPVRGLPYHFPRDLFGYYVKLADKLDLEDAFNEVIVLKEAIPEYVCDESYVDFFKPLIKRFDIDKLRSLWVWGDPECYILNTIITERIFELNQLEEENEVAVGSSGYSVSPLFLSGLFGLYSDLYPFDVCASFPFLSICDARPFIWRFTDYWSPLWNVAPVNGYPFSDYFGSFMGMQI